MGGQTRRHHLDDACGLNASTRRDPISAQERAFIDQQRASVRASWQACAAMVDRNVHDVRMVCDPDYAGRGAAGGEARVIGDAPKPQPRVALSPGGDTLRALSEGARTAKDIADRRAVAPAAVATALNRYLDKAWVSRSVGPGTGAPFQWRLTVAGEKALSGMIARAEALRG